MYADIIVDIASGRLDRSFQYTVPEMLSQEACIGSQVMIPFGSGGRLVKGFIVGFSDTTDYDASKIKPIVKVINDEVTAENQMIRLAEWMRNVYGSTMLQALKTVLPVRDEIRAVVAKYYRPAAAFHMAKEILRPVLENRRSKAKARLMAWFLENPDTMDGEFGWHTKEEVLSGSGVSAATLKAAVREGLVLESTKQVYRKPVKVQSLFGGHVALNEQQQKAVSGILDSREKVHLMFGVTGSGKTEVYMDLIAHMLDEGRQVIVLIPEISLTLQTVTRFYERFGERVSVMNSKLSAGERYDQYLRAKRGEIDIVVGPRSALFMPFPNLGMIIIDEEHDGAYKSEKSPKYHAREAAIYRAGMCGAKVVLGSATPSVSTYAKALSGEYGLHRLTARAKRESVLPDIVTVDLREEFKMKNKRIFSTALQDMMADCLSRGEQMMLFLNRRGYAGFVSCRSCGYVLKCKHCDVSLTAHTGGYLKCHYCGYETPLPKVCPKCGSKYIAGFGTGTQKVEQMVKDIFPQARVLRLDRDTASGRDNMKTILSDFREYKADVLVGTQMIVKGHDFPKVTLVGILAADLSMYSGDYMAAERTFQLLVQAAGRAGRGELPGKVVIQTYNPEHYSIQTAASQDYEGFYRQEIAFRQMMHYPPASNIQALLGECADEDLLMLCMESIKRAVGNSAGRFGDTPIEAMGPANAYVSKGKDVYRKVLYFKCTDLITLMRLKQAIEAYLVKNTRFEPVYIQFDMNPMTMY